MNSDKILAKYNLDPEKEFFSTQDIADLIDRSTVMVNRYYTLGALGDPVKKIAKRYIWKRETVEAFILNFDERKYSSNPSRKRGVRSPRKDYRKQYQQMELLEVKDNENT